MLHFAALALVLATAPALAQMQQRTDLGEAAIDAFAYGMDLNGDAQISPIEMNMASRQIFTAMDDNSDDLVSRDEMVGWEQDMRSLARFRGRMQAYNATMGLVFTLFDSDRDNMLTRAEHSDGLGQAWRVADRDGNGTMSMAEFRDDFLVTSALRAAVTE